MNEWILPVIATIVVIGVIYFSAKQSAADQPQFEPVVRSTNAEGADAPPLSEPDPTTTQLPGRDWTVWGWLLAIGGAVGLAISLYMEISVETYTASSILGPGGASQVVNLDLMFHKGVAVAGSLATLMAGLFCFAVGAIIRAIHSR